MNDGPCWPVIEHTTRARGGFVVYTVVDEYGRRRRVALDRKYTTDEAARPILRAACAR